jgi:alkylation response protein AidB-like acyl-CoA dehydrogenase
VRGRVPIENVIGEENNGIAVMIKGLDIERAFFQHMVWESAKLHSLKL